MNKEFEKWIIDNYERESLCLDSLYEGFMKFKKPIARVLQEALIRLVERQIVNHLAVLQIKIESLKKKREKIREMNFIAEMFLMKMKIIQRLEILLMKCFLNRIQSRVFNLFQMIPTLWTFLI